VTWEKRKSKAKAQMAKLQSDCNAGILKQSNRSSAEQEWAAIPLQLTLEAQRFAPRRESDCPILDLVQTIEDVFSFIHVAARSCPERRRQERSHAGGNMVARPIEDLPTRVFSAELITSRTERSRQIFAAAGIRKWKPIGPHWFVFASLVHC